MRRGGDQELDEPVVFGRFEGLFHGRRRAFRFGGMESDPVTGSSQDVLKGEVGRGGYDIVLECGGVIRHIQLKSTFAGSTVNEVTVSTRPSEKPSGCAVWLEVDRSTLA